MFSAVNNHAQRHAGKYAGGAVAISLCAVLLAHWEGEDRTAKHNYFDPPGVITVCDGVTNYDWPSLKVGEKFTQPTFSPQAYPVLLPIAKAKEGTKKQHKTARIITDCLSCLLLNIIFYLLHRQVFRQ